ncbi:hypothetical protein FACS18949_02820 [Clostridia bacterium]|nr:hypothetical protein FACS18949_02820 [Clostridia bacterium]
MNETARRLDLKIILDGADISDDINRRFITCTFTDNEEDKADDLTLTIDDREGLYIKNALELKGASLQVIAIQKNWTAAGSERVLDCGIFSVDTIDFADPPAVISIKGTSLPYSGSVRTATTTRAWENITLSAIARQIANKAGLTLMYESDSNTLYNRREQIQQSDILFLRGLCKGAGISLKVTSKILVLFDEEKYESKAAITTITRGTSDIKSARFSMKTGDVSYGKCHVSYTNPVTGKAIEYTYTPRDYNPENDTQILEVNEKVKDREEARKLAMKRLRQKNKAENEANFSLVGDVRLAAGSTIIVSGYGQFDGKYIIETATHSFTGGYTTELKLRKVLEGY